MGYEKEGGERKERIMTFMSETMVQKCTANHHYSMASLKQ